MSPIVRHTHCRGRPVVWVYSDATLAAARAANTDTLDGPAEHVHSWTHTFEVPVRYPRLVRQWRIGLAVRLT